jgi:pimeloyl-ACP methyl ester carboxylesterase
MWDARLHGKSRPGEARGGFGETLDDLLSVLDAEGIGRAILIGQSMGGNIAQEFALRHPGRVDRLVVIDSAYNYQRLSGIESLMVKSSPLIFGAYPWKALVRASAKASVISPQGRAYLEECFERMGKRDFVTVFSGLLGCLREGAGPIGKDILLVIGDKDGTGNIRKAAPLWLAREPRCRLEFLEDSGHGSNMDAPERFNALLSDFLEGGPHVRGK